MADDPFAVLGVPRDADEAALRAARRRLAQSLHPDHEGGDATRMRHLNAAFESALGSLQRSQEQVPATSQPSPRPPPQPTPPPRMTGRVAHDVASFTIEALLVVASWLGEVLVEEPPYQLDVELAEPFDCWCRLDLVPDAGSCTVAITLVSSDGATLPDLDAVRDAWVAELNQLGRPDPS